MLRFLLTAPLPIPFPAPAAPPAFPTPLPTPPSNPWTLRDCHMPDKSKSLRIAMGNFPAIPQPPIFRKWLCCEGIRGDNVKSGHEFLQHTCMCRSGGTPPPRPRMCPQPHETGSTLQMGICQSEGQLYAILQCAKFLFPAELPPYHASTQAFLPPRSLNRERRKHKHAFEGPASPVPCTHLLNDSRLYVSSQYLNCETNFSVCANCSQLLATFQPILVDD